MRRMTMRPSGFPGEHLVFRANGLECVTVSDELKAGRALARFSQAPEEPLRMHLDWQWLTGDQSKGTSEWIGEPS